MYKPENLRFSLKNLQWRQLGFMTGTRKSTWTPVVYALTKKNVIGTRTLVYMISGTMHPHVEMMSASEHS
jgi:hypothetical protein